MLKQNLLIWLAAMMLPMAVLGVNNEEEDDALTKGNIIGMFTEFDRAIANDQKNEEQTAFPYRENANMIAFWLKNNRFIEVDTEIDRSWFERAAKMLDYMGECKTFMVSFIRRDDIPKSPEYQKVKHNLEEAHKRFAELVKNPTPVDKDKLNKLREEKAKWEAQKRREQH
ncbi:MAG: hypothetical protein WCV67_20955 [Victivallaceae bacterium]|jgi:hypothetical protein